MRVLKNHNHDNGDTNSSGGPAYQPQAAAQDHEHYENCSKASKKVKTQAGHDKRCCPVKEDILLLLGQSERSASDESAQSIHAALFPALPLPLLR